MNKYDMAEQYVSQPSNWGPDDSEQRAAEYDAFLAGYEAAVTASSRGENTYRKEQDRV